MKKGMGLAGALMEDALYEQLTALDIPAGERHARYETMILEWLSARDEKRVPRVYLGARKESSTQRSFYLKGETVKMLKFVADEDGVSVAQVVRTALAWAVSGNVSVHDMWDTDAIFGARSVVLRSYLD